MDVIYDDKTMADLPISASSVTRVPLEAFAGQCQRSMQPLVDSITYFSTATLEEDQVRQFLREPAQATPRSLLEKIPPIRLVLVPFIEKGSGGSTDYVSFERPASTKSLARSAFELEEAVFIFLSAEGQDVADYHYWFYNGIAEQAASRVDEAAFARFTGLVADELSRNARGEVDERSYQLKQKVSRKQRLPGSDSKLMQEYFRQALEDTLTLYLHGLCCDIDVEPGSRQLASRYLRKRLELLQEVFPPNPGYNVFPAEPKQREENPEA